MIAVSWAARQASGDAARWEKKAGYLRCAMQLCRQGCWIPMWLRVTGLFVEERCGGPLQACSNARQLLFEQAILKE